MATIDLLSGDTVTSVSVEPDGRVTVGSTVYAVEPIGEGWYLVSDGRSRWRVAVAGPADNRWVFVNGQVARVEVATDTRARPRSTPGDAGVMSPMPATVVAISALVGRAVRRGDTLLVLEAMKMELPIRAPRDGVVAALHCAVGDLVSPGVTLLEFV